jgi:hypothetical protein
VIATAHSLDPAADALLALLRAQIDDGMLEEIAAADYGHRIEENLAALRQIRDTGEIPVPLPWEPREVLELIRWSEPEDPEWKPGSTGERGHRMRAFACATLLRAAAELTEAAAMDGENQTLAQLLASVFVLGEEAQQAALRFLAWRVPLVAPGYELPFFRLAQLILAVHLRAGSATEMVSLAEQIERDEAAERAAVEPCFGDPRWLLGLTFQQIRHTVWVRLTHQMLEEASAIADPAAREAVEELALRVLCG